MAAEQSTLFEGRRRFLKVSGALCVYFAAGLDRLGATEDVAAKSVDPTLVGGYLKISSDGRLTVYSGKVDLGTGVRTALSQIVADELDIAFSRVELIQGDTALTPDQGVTFGSLSIQNGGVQLRQAAATARQALLQKASVKWGSDASALKTKDGHVVAPDGRQIAYEELIDAGLLTLHLDKAAPVKRPELFEIVGKPIARLDIPDKIYAQFQYMQDFRLPGMLHGRAVRPPGIGSQLISVDESSIADIPGVVKIVTLGNFVGVVAKDEWSAIRAARSLKVSWSDWQGLPDEREVWDFVRHSKVAKDDVTSNKGDTAQALKGAAKTLTATYDFAIHTHGSIGPSCAVAQFDGEHLTCWSASQATHNLRKQLAAMLKCAPDLVRCIYIDGAGCYGRNGHEDAAADAVLLARAVGAPVRVQWMRADEHGWDPKGPPTLLDMRGGLDHNGDIVVWESELFVPNGAANNVSLVAADHAGLDSASAQSPGGVINDLAIPYTIANVKTVAHRLESTPFKPSWIRSPGRMQNSFANEAFFDELCAAAKRDPLDARLALVHDERGRELLRRVAALSHWSERKKVSSGTERTGFGLCYIKYELVRTYVAVVCEASVNMKTGEIKAKRFYVAHDCGQIINPDGLKNQIEGNVIQTVSRVLKEQIRFSRANVTSVDWASYPILRFPDIPDVLMDLIDRPTEVPWGAGEPTAALVPAAISNAVFDAIGKRLRSIPFTPDKVLAAMEAT